MLPETSLPSRFLCGWAMLCVAGVLAGGEPAGGAASAASQGPGPFTYDWFRDDALARHVSMLTDAEVARLAGSPLIGMRPVLIPHPEVLGGEDTDYFDWPIATVAGSSIVVLYDRRPFHFHRVARDKTPVTEQQRAEARASAARRTTQGVRWVVASHDGGRTWSTPVDLFGLGRWDASPLGMWGGAIGSRGESVYVLLAQGLYVSDDAGRSWRFAQREPAWGDVPPSRVASILQVDDERGIVLWTTEQFTGDDRPWYGRKLRAVWTPDLGKTWRWQEQEIPAEIPPETMSFSELTPVRQGQRLLFFNRNLRNHSGKPLGPFAQVWSSTGWFPFRFARTNVTGGTDSPGLIYNPRSRRFEATVSARCTDTRANPQLKGPHEQNLRLDLWSIDPDDVFVRDRADAWRFEGSLVRFKSPWTDAKTNCDGINPMGDVVYGDWHLVFGWSGDGAAIPWNRIGPAKAGIFMYARSLDTDAVRRYLLGTP